MEIFYTKIPIFSQYLSDISESNSELLTAVSHNSSLRDMFNYVKEKEYCKQMNLLSIGLINNNEIVCFTLNKTLYSSLPELPSPMINLILLNHLECIIELFVHQIAHDL